MLELARIDEIVREVAGTYLDGSVEEVRNELTVDSLGRDALLVTLVLSAKAHDRGKDSMLQTIVGIQSELELAGEERFPIVQTRLVGEADEGVEPES